MKKVARDSVARRRSETADVGDRDNATLVCRVGDAPGYDSPRKGTCLGCVAGRSPAGVSLGRERTKPTRSSTFQ